MLSKLLMGRSSGNFDGWVIASGDDSGIGTRDDLYIFPWNPSVGFGTPNKYAMGSQSGLYMWSALSPDAKTLLVENSIALYNYVWIYPFDIETGTLGTVYPDTMGSTSIAGGAVWHPDSSVFLLRYSQSPYLGALQFEEGTGVIGAYASPIGAPQQFAYSGTWTPNGNVFLAGYFANFSTTQTVRAWPWTYSGGFGSQISLPSLGGYPYDYIQALAFNKEGTKLAVPNGSRMYAYDWSDTTGWSNKTEYTWPSEITPRLINDAVWHPDGDFILCGTQGSGTSGDTSSVFAFPIASDGTFGDPIETPSQVQASCRKVLFSPDGNVAFAVFTQQSGSHVPPYLRAWKWNRGSGFGEEYPAATEIVDDLYALNFTLRAR